MKFQTVINLIKRLLGAKTKGVIMAKADVVAAGLAAIQSGVTQVYSDQLGLAYDGGFKDGVASVPVSTGGGFQQSDIDAAVKAAKDADALALSASQAADAQAFSDAKAASDSAIAALQSKFDDLAKKEGSEASVIAGLQGSLQAIKDAEAALQSLFPAPVPPVVVPPTSPSV